MIKSSLERFVNAQDNDYDTALSEIRAGRKRTHWMHYAIRGMAEAEDYFRHPLLGPRLIEISKALLQLDTSHATAIFGSPDDLKLKSCMTWFALVPQTDPVFASVLQKFFGGRMDELTVRLIATGRSG